ncbi:MAG: hypothetical protein J2P45_25260, partial [Candidatus Dormibacteraeota bacterium]|nr:hypothetical protein [Candidatus Dormibacteraeota bacterium]
MIWRPFRPVARAGEVQFYRGPDGSHRRPRVAIVDDDAVRLGTAQPDLGVVVEQAGPKLRRVGLTAQEAAGHPLPAVLDLVDQAPRVAAAEER